MSDQQFVEELHKPIIKKIKKKKYNHLLYWIFGGGDLRDM